MSFKIKAEENDHAISDFLDYGFRAMKVIDKLED